MATHEKTKFNEASLSDQANTIRDAFKKGRKQVLVNGIMLKLEMVTKQVVHTFGDARRGETKSIRQTEQWIRATPENGRTVPILLVERERGKNSVFTTKATTVR